MTDDLIARLRAFVVERGKIACGSDIVSACNNSALSLSDLRDLLAELEAAREDAGRWNEMCRQIDAGEFHPSILDDAMNMGAGALEMHVDDAIDAAREARNG